MNTSNDDIYKKIKSLPQDIQDAYFSDDFAQKILDIGKKNGLTMDKVGIFGDEIRNVMLGIIQTSDFIKNIADGLDIDKEKAKSMAEEVNQQIFQPIKASLRKVHGLPEKPKTTPPANSPQTTSPSPYVIPTKPATGSTAPVIPAPPAKPAGTVIIEGTKLDFAPLPAPGKKSDFPGKSDFKEGVATPIPPIFAKKITPIDTLLDKIDAGDSTPKPKLKIDSSALQLNPPPAPSGIRTMLQDAKSFLSRASSPTDSKPATTAPIHPPEPLITMPKQEKFNTVPPPVIKPVGPTTTAIPAKEEKVPLNLPVAPTTPPQNPAMSPIPKPETTIINASPKPEPAAGLTHERVKAEIENVLGGKIKVEDKSIVDPYKEPID